MEQEEKMSKSRVGESWWGEGGGLWGGAASSWASPSHDTRIVSADQGGAAKISGAVISKFWLQYRAVLGQSGSKLNNIVICPCLVATI